MITLDGAKRDGYLRTKQFFSTLPQETVIIWNGSPSMESFYSRLWTEGLVDTAGGKGRSLWMASGYLLARRDTDVIAVHDADILTYERSLLARLIYPSCTRAWNMNSPRDTMPGSPTDSMEGSCGCSSSPSYVP